MRVLLATALALATADAATRVAVIELGKSGTVRRTTATNEQTSASGVASFWASLHGYGRKLQQTGMTVVPDLFSRPESGVVVSLTGVDLETMPNLNALMNEEEKRVVGHMEVYGQQSSDMLRNINNVQEVQYAGLATSFQNQAAEAGISAMNMAVTSENASELDLALDSLIEKASTEATDAGKTVVLHLVVEEDEGAARRRHLSRRLQEDEAEGEQQNNEGQGDQDADQQQNYGYYGYGYYNAYGEWVTPYKTMFQIQYFNVVLWTSVGLAATLFFGMYKFVNMPLMADTLLFGESAKVTND